MNPLVRSGLRMTVALLAAMILLHPFFWVIFRLAIFETVPHDDYAPYLLWLVGDPGGALPPSPYCYRILSVVAALPFYLALPAIPLTNIPPGVLPAYQHATAAICALSYLGAIGAGVLAYAVATAKAGLRGRDGVIAGTLLFALCWYTQITAIDTPALALIAAGLLLIDLPLGFAALMLLSVLLNEKINLVLAIWLSVRCCLSAHDRVRWSRQWFAAVASVAIYFAMVKLVHIPGHAYQLDPDSYPSTLRENLGAYLSPRGVLLNALPIAILIGIAALGIRGGSRYQTMFRSVDMLVIGGLVVVALFLTHLFQAGRIVMHAAPLFVAPAAAAIGRWVDAGLASGATARSDGTGGQPDSRGTKRLTPQREPI